MEKINCVTCLSMNCMCVAIKFIDLLTMFAIGVQYAMVPKRIIFFITRLSCICMYIKIVRVLIFEY